MTYPGKRCVKGSVVQTLYNPDAGQDKKEDVHCALYIAGQLEQWH